MPNQDETIQTSFEENQSVTSLDVAKVAELDRARCDAMIAQDFTSLESLIGEDLTYHHSNGRADTRESWIAGLRAGEVSFLKIDSTDVNTRTFADTILMTGISNVVVSFNGEEQENSLRFTTTWAKRAGDWKMVSWACSRLP
jgi:ketosteroid isomerase-like protein